MSEKKWPMLYQKASTGKIKQWQIETIMRDSSGVIVREFGQVGGKIQHKEKVISKGKNIGRSNETTPIEQAYLEADSLYEKQRDKGYVPDPSGESDILLPMLAQSFDKSGHRMPWPVIVQPKLNGVRCLATHVNGDDGPYIDFRSRKGKSYNGTLKHLEEPLLRVLKEGETIDGEIYIHGALFQEIVRLVKKYRPGESERLQFWAYDMVMPEAPFKERLLKLLRYTEELGDERIVQVKSYFAQSAEIMEKEHDGFVKDGFEGIIIRNIEGKYGINKRSVDLQKFKKFYDKEVKIIGAAEPEIQHVIDDDGNIVETLECVVFLVRDEFGNEFNSRPRGSYKRRARWQKDIGNIVGKDLTIRYQELSEDNVPVFNVGIEIRDYE